MKASLGCGPWGGVASVKEPCGGRSSLGTSALQLGFHLPVGSRQGPRLLKQGCRRNKPKENLLPRELCFLPERIPRPTLLPDGCSGKSPRRPGNCLPQTLAAGAGTGPGRVPFLLEAGEKDLSGLKITCCFFPKKLGRGRRTWEQPPPVYPWLFFSPLETIKQ